MDNTENLALPYIMPSQAQKHVTHNEALRALDAIVQLAVLDKDLAAPPGSPAPGVRYIVGAGASGAWVGHTNDVAAWQDEAWAFYRPVAGWLAWVHDESQLYLFAGGGWTAAPGGGGSGIVPKGAWSGAQTYSAGDLVEHEGHAFLSNIDGNLDNEPDSGTPGSTAEWTYFAIVTGEGSGDVNPTPFVGVNATANTTNRLTVSSPASLFDHDGADHRLKINKAAAGDTASVLFQTDFVGHAEFGLAGDNDWHVKVSPDGDIWHEAIVVDRTTGAVSLPNTAGVGGGRELLTAPRTYYVATSLGDDGNAGLSAGAGAFATIQKAVDTAAGLDLGVHDVTIEVADGTYAPFEIKRCIGAGSVYIVGNTGSPSAVHVTSATPGANIIRGSNVVTPYNMSGMRLSSTGGGSSYLISASGNTVISFGHMQFGQAFIHIYSALGAYVTNNGPYEIIAGAARHLWAFWGGQIYLGSGTVTLSGTPAFSTAFAAANDGGRISAFVTFSGSATGTRYNVTLNGVAAVSGGAGSYFPGNAAGATATGGQYA